MAFGDPSKNADDEADEPSVVSFRAAATLLCGALLLGFGLLGIGLLGTNLLGPPGEPAIAPESVPPAAAKPTAIVIPFRDNLAGCGEPIFTSPTAGRALDLSHFVPGAAVVVALRPAEIMAIPDKYRLLDPVVLGNLGP
jgi:hypothetical protein